MPGVVIIWQSENSLQITWLQMVQQSLAEALARPITPSLWQVPEDLVSSASEVIGNSLVFSKVWSSTACPVTLLSYREQLRSSPPVLSSLVHFCVLILVSYFLQSVRNGRKEGKQGDFRHSCDQTRRLSPRWESMYRRENVPYSFLQGGLFVIIENIIEQRISTL